MNRYLFIALLCSFFGNNIFAQCTTLGTESEAVIIPTTSDQTTGATKGLGAGASRIYQGFTPGNSYTLALDNGPGNLTCREAIFLDDSDTPIGSSWFDISSTTTEVSPAGAAKLWVTTSRAGAHSATSATLTYRVNTTVVTPVSITGTTTDEDCPSDDNGAISSIDISDGLSDVQYIKLIQRRTTDNHINLAELRAFSIFGGGNVALGAAVTSNVAAHSWGPYDGLTDGNTGTGGEDHAHTGSPAYGNYLQVDLGSGQDLDYIEIVNRNTCCYIRSSDLLLELYNSSGKLVYSNPISLPSSSLGTYTQNVLDVSWADGATTLNRTGLDGGDYTLNYSDVAGNTAAEIFSVSTRTLSTDPISASPSSGFSCSGDNVSLSVTGGSLGTGATWEWYDDAALTSSVGSGSPLSVSPTVNTTYYVRAEGLCNNTASVSTSVTVNGGSTAPSASVSLATSTTSATCVVDDANWHYFYNTSGELLAGINSNGIDLGNVTIEIVVGDNGPFGQGFISGTICGTGDAINGEYVVPRYWDITVENQPSSSVDVIFYYTNADVASLVSTTGALDDNYKSCWGEVSSEADLMMTVQHAGSNELFTSLSPGAGPGAGQRQIQFQLDEFSSGYLHSSGGIHGANALPVELLTFSAKTVNDHILVEWQTASEIDNEGFELLRSTNGVDFEKTAWIDGHGSTTNVQDYQYIDKDVSAGTYYYKLRQIDFDGESEEFHVVSARLSAKEGLNISDVRPNPTSSTIAFDISTASASSVKMKIYNYTGQVVYTNEQDLSVGETTIRIDETSSLSSGAYFILLDIDGEIQTKKFVINR